MKQIVVTGAAGFIGSCLISQLNKELKTQIIAVDDFSREDKKINLQDKKVSEYIDRSEFLSWFKANYNQVSAIYHIGARTDTTEQNLEIFEALNLSYSKSIWSICVQHQIPLIYASSAATYGLGEFGYSDNHDCVTKLKPLNPYGRSKNDFDKWVLTQDSFPPFWAGLKFFNVYGPNEYHKGRMASVIFHTYQKIMDSGSMSLFKSHRPDFEDGHQSRDFIYVKDLLAVAVYLMENSVESGIYNLGSGVSNTFLDLATFTFNALDKTPSISFIDTPEDIRETYQYYTCADMNKLLKNGYPQPFFSLKDGVTDYVQNYLVPNKTF